MIVPTSTATAPASPTPTEIVPSTVVAAAPGEQYVSILDHQYFLPNRWTEISTDSSVVLYDPTNKVQITISESMVSRSKYRTVGALGIEKAPLQPEGWTIWDQVYRNWPSPGDFYEFLYRGVNEDIEYVNVVRWYMWGQVVVEVSAEIPTVDWDEQGTRYDSMMQVLDSFKPHIDGPLLQVDDVMAALALRMDSKFSGLYGRDEEIRARVELTCQQIFEDYMQPPLFIGEGVWVVSAPTLESVEYWRIFEPSGEIVSEITNKSVC